MLGKSTALGRNKEKTVEQQLRSFGDTNNQEDDRVKIKYFDKRGKELKGKEAFRQMCWKFHGKMPSHRKQEKRRQQEEVETKQMQISVGLNPKLMAIPGGPGTKDPKKSLGSLGSSAAGIKKPKKI